MGSENLSKCLIHVFLYETDFEGVIIWKQCILKKELTKLF